MTVSFGFTVGFTEADSSLHDCVMADESNQPGSASRLLLNRQPSPRAETPRVRHHDHDHHHRHFAHYDHQQFPYGSAPPFAGHGGAAPFGSHDHRHWMPFFPPSYALGSAPVVLSAVAPRSTPVYGAPPAVLPPSVPKSVPAKPATSITTKSNAAARQVQFPEGRPAFSATVRDPNDVTRIPLVTWDALNTVGVQSAEVCSIADIHPVRQASLPVRYYGKAATPNDTIVVATATFPDGRTKRVQRVMLGQLWSEAFATLHIHFIGKLLAYMCGDQVTVYGLEPVQAHRPSLPESGMDMPLEAVRTQAQRPVPTMVGPWLSIDPGDHTQDALLDLQRAQMCLCLTPRRDSLPSLRSRFVRERKSVALGDRSRAIAVLWLSSSRERSRCLD